MTESSDTLSYDELKSIAGLETALEERAVLLAITLGRSLGEGRGLSDELLRGLREAHADLLASREVSDLAARRAPDWQLREEAAADLRRERVETQHRVWLMQIQAADRGSDRLADLVRVVAKIAADIVSVVDRAPPAEVDVDARVEDAKRERHPGA